MRSCLASMHYLVNRNDLCKNFLLVQYMLDCTKNNYAIQPDRRKVNGKDVD
ncbi:hypothetical protein DFO54_10851 [Erwinia sp. AG740]|nr:hypothetical protein DFO54_10851 [Erwinia sp. AG740]